MIRALYPSATGLNAQTTLVDNTANNIANVNTNGFKKGQADFQDLIYVTERGPGADAAQGLQIPTGLQIGSCVRVAGVTKAFTQGALINTQNSQDVAINGDGFFQITLPNGDLRYTRDGALRRNAIGTLVTADGFVVTPQITVPAEGTNLNIAADGTVSVRIPGSAVDTPVGQLTLTRFPNPSGMSAEGKNLFAETGSSGPPITATPGLNGTGVLLQGFLERSNVEVVNELVNPILAQRAYEFNTRAIQTSDNMLESTAGLIR